MLLTRSIKKTSVWVYIVCDEVNDAVLIEFFLLVLIIFLGHMATEQDKTLIGIFILCFLLVIVWIIIPVGTTIVGIWIASNYIAYRYIFYDSQKSAEKVVAMGNKVQEKQAKVGMLSFLISEVVNPTVDKITEEDRKFQNLIIKACAQYGAFCFFSTSIALIYLSPSVALIFSSIAALGFLMKPEPESFVDQKAKLRIMYFDYFFFSGAIIINGQYGNPVYIGVLNKWFHVSDTKNPDSEHVSSEYSNIVKTN